MERLVAARRQSPEVTITANERAMQEQMGVYPGEPWTASRHARQELMPQCGNLTTLKRIRAVLAAALDEGRLRGAQQQHTFLWHAYRVFENAAVTEGHDVSWAWPLLGICGARLSLSIPMGLHLWPRTAGRTTALGLAACEGGWRGGGVAGKFGAWLAVTPASGRSSYR